MRYKITSEVVWGLYFSRQFPDVRYISSVTYEHIQEVRSETSIKMNDMLYAKIFALQTVSPTNSFFFLHFESGLQLFRPPSEVNP